MTFLAFHAKKYIYSLKNKKNPNYLFFFNFYIHFFRNDTYPTKFILFFRVGVTPSDGVTPRPLSTPLGHRTTHYLNEITQQTLCQNVAAGSTSMLSCCEKHRILKSIKSIQKHFLVGSAKDTVQRNIVARLSPGERSMYPIWPTGRTPSPGYASSNSSGRHQTMECSLKLPQTHASQGLDTRLPRPVIPFGPRIRILTSWPRILDVGHYQWLGASSTCKAWCTNASWSK